MIDELAAQRSRNTQLAKDASPRDMLHRMLLELEEEQIVSVMAIAIKADGDSVSYSAGPDVNTFSKAWTILQSECLKVIDRMTGG